MPEANKAFVELKQFLTTPPVMMAPQAGETLLIYIAATNRVVSTTSHDAYKVQHPVYFISEVLNESKAQYP